MKNVIVKALALYIDENETPTKELQEFYFKTNLTVCQSISYELYRPAIQAMIDNQMKGLGSYILQKVDFIFREQEPIRLNGDFYNELSIVADNKNLSTGLNTLINSVKMLEAK